MSHLFFDGWLPTSLVEQLDLLAPCVFLARACVVAPASSRSLVKACSVHSNIKHRQSSCKFHSVCFLVAGLNCGLEGDPFLFEQRYISHDVD